jgi:prepilin-type N-terminal cleavage/methylation domain-containing protein
MKIGVMKTKFNAVFGKGRKKSESGFTIIEILVAIALLAIVSIVVTSTILNASQSNEKFARGTMNESQLVDSTSLITREISLSTNIVQAGDDNVVMDTLEGGLPYREHFFMWMGSPAVNPGDLGIDQTFITKYGIDTSTFPKVPTLMEYKVANGDTTHPIIRTLIDGYSPGASASPIFKYFDAQNNQILLDTTTYLVPSANLVNIKRIELRFTSYITGRDLPMELATSAVPRSAVMQGTSPVQLGQTILTLPAPFLQGNLPPGTTTANLSWGSIAGATGYTLYRENRLQVTSPQVVAIIPNGSTTTFSDTNLTWGENYTYSITASGPAGVSPVSNKITLTVVPDKTKFINFNTKQPEPVANFTVARDLKNQLTWQAMNGATGYTLFRAGVQIYQGPSTTWADTGRSYGDITSYTVQAYNSGQYGSGGNGLVSDPASLISPPKAPAINGVANDTNSGANSTNTITIQAAVPNATSYSYQSGAAPGTTTAEWTSGSSLNANQTVNWGTTFCYANFATNDAGFSPKSNIVCLNQKPGPFGILSITQTAREYYTNTLEYDGVTSASQPGSLVASWQAAAGAANGYNTRVNITDYRGGAGVSGTADRSASTASTSLTTTTVTPGVVYTYTVTALASNGTSRTTSKTVQTQPDVPQTGEVFITCSNFANGYQYMNYGYDSTTTPRYGGADYTQRKQFAVNNETAYGTGLDGNLSVGYSTAITGSDTSSGLYTSGFTLQNFLGVTADYGTPNSAIMKAYGTYHHLLYNGTSWYDAPGDTPPSQGFSGCGGAGTFVEPSNPCYGYTAATFYAGCTMGTGRPNWTTQ